jgi:hypothetical protein
MSKLNPQKASAYVGPGVLRKGGKITPVPNGPLIKKTGKFKGSTLKSGGVIKKAQGGDTLSPYMQKRAAQLKVREENTRKRDSILQRNANAQGKTREEVRARQERDKGKQVDIYNGQSNASEKPDVRGSCTKGNYYSRKNGGPIKKAKAGAMIKRADGSYSKRGLWDNIRANKGSGKKPTKQMLVQEKKIKAKTKK